MLVAGRLRAGLVHCLSCELLRTKLGEYLPSDPRGPLIGFSECTSRLLDPICKCCVTECFLLEAKADSNSQACKGARLFDWIYLARFP